MGRVLVVDDCGEFVPDFFRFEKGSVDKEDLSLSKSKENLWRYKILGIVEKSLVGKLWNLSGKWQMVLKIMGNSVNNFRGMSN